jgi:regulator of RNase E activity RraA
MGARGVRGVVVDGACRDVADAQELAFPVYARASVAATARGDGSGSAAPASRS